MSTPPLISAVDLGYGYVKAVKSTNTEPIIYPSVIAPYRAPRFQTGLGGEVDLRVITLNGRSYFVGDGATGKPGAIREAGRSRSDNLSASLLFLDALARLWPKGVGNLKVVTGLPHEWLSDKDIVKQSMIGEHVVAVNGDSITLEVADVEVISQHYGAMASMVYDFDSTGFKVKDRALLASNIGVVDFGTKTFGWCRFNRNRLDDDRSGSEPHGMLVILTELRRRLNEPPYRLDLTIPEVERALIDGSVYIGESVEVMPIIKDTVREMADITAADIRGDWDTGKDLTTIICSGGGADLMSSPFALSYGHPNVVSLSNPQAANVQGMLLYGFYLLRQQWK